RSSARYSLYLHDALPIYSGGGWSEGLVAHESQLHTVPDELGDEDAVLVEPLACALHAARIADVQPGENVAIIGVERAGERLDEQDRKSTRLNSSHVAIPY